MKKFTLSALAALMMSVSASAQGSVTTTYVKASDATAINNAINAAIGAGKIKTAALMTGVALTFFYNWPFELININVNELLLYFACVMSIISAVQYFNMNKKIIFPEQKNID